MKANLENIQIIYGSIPETWVVNEARTDGYDLLIENHFSDGWRDVIIPDITENQKLSDEYVLVNDIVTKIVIQKTQEEIDNYNKSLVPQTVSQRQLRTQLALNGFNLNSVQTAIDSLSEPSKTIAQIAWDYALTFVRTDSLLISLAGILGISEIELDTIFINANKL